MVPNRLYPGQTPGDCPAQVIHIRNKRLFARGAFIPAGSVADSHQCIVGRLQLGRETVQRGHEHLASSVPPPALPLLERGLGVGLLQVGLLLRRLLVGRPCYVCCRHRRPRRRRGILGWSVVPAPEEVVADDVVHDLFQQLANQHAHRGLPEPRAPVAVLACVACPLFVVAIPAAAPAALWLPLLGIPACWVPKCVLPVSPGGIAPFANGPQDGSRLSWPRATGGDVWVLGRHTWPGLLNQRLPII